MSLFRDKDTGRYLRGITILLIILLVSVKTGQDVCIILASICMWLLSIFFLKRREKEYIEATEVVERFEDGDFSIHLSKNQEGSFYAFLSHVDRLAMTLRSRIDTEADSRKLINERISDISHQLKTPLAALFMYNEIMENEKEDLKVMEEFNRKSKNSLLRMQQLIQSLLTMTRLDSGCIVFQKDRYFVGDILREAIGELQIRADKEEKEITMCGNENDVLLCDKKWTLEALSNIVKNSLDHTNAHGKINIHWSMESGVTRIVIQDNGSGIKSEDICHIFKRFYRCADSKNKGVGLGLPLAKSIIEGQGGTILLDSIWGEGTTMKINFLSYES